MKAILDLDTGIDDALALAYAIAHPDLDLIGVTCTYGNVTVPLAVRNTLALLELLGHDDIPVFAGPSPDGFRPSDIFLYPRPQRRGGGPASAGNHPGAVPTSGRFPHRGCARARR